MDLSPLSSPEATPEPESQVIQEHPAAFESNLEEVPVVITSPKLKRAKSTRKMKGDVKLEDGDTPSKKRRRKTAPAEIEVPPPLKKIRTPRKRKTIEPTLPKEEFDQPPLDGTLTSTTLVDEPLPIESTDSLKKKRSPRKRKTVDGSVPIKPDDDFVLDEGAEAPKVKRKRKPKVVEPVVYDIPPVERKYSEFKGRLGYVSSFPMLSSMC